MSGPAAPARCGADAPDLRLDGKVAVVTGASRGIGRGCALALSSAGAAVVLVSRSEPDLERLADEIETRGGSAVAVACDVGDARRVRAAFDVIPRVDVLVNSAGGNRPAPFPAVTEETLDWMWRLNVRGTFLFSQAAVQRMLAVGRGGSVVNVTSQMGHVGAPERTVYCATKHAVEGLTKAMAVELAPMGIRVNAVAPTFIDTPMTRPFFAEPGAREEVVRRIPLGRIGDVRDVTAAVVFLAAPAARLITGTSLLVDGGWTAQ